MSKVIKITLVPYRSPGTTENLLLVTKLVNAVTVTNTIDGKPQVFGVGDCISYCLAESVNRRELVEVTIINN